MNFELCYYPTTILGVDDDPIFLQNFSLALDPDLAFRRCATPSEALEIAKQSVSSYRDQGLVSRYRDYAGRDIEDGAHAVVVLDLSGLWKSIFRPSRFEEVSVAIVDFAMPEMDGLAFCRKLTGTRIKKIMLTGRMDEHLAIEALNEGIIDGFVTKGDSDAPKKIGELVNRLQRNYFAEVNFDLENLLLDTSPKFLHDAVIADYLRDEWRRRDITEYYLTLNPPGYVAVSRSGEVLLSVIMADEDFASHEDIIRDSSGPQDLLEMLSRRNVVPYFWRGGGYYRGEDDWRDQIYDAQIVEGENAKFSLSFINNPPSIVGGDQTVVSYSQFLEAFDLDSSPG